MKEKLAFSATLFLALMILWAAFSPGGPALSGWAYQDKIQHVLAFSALVLPMTWACPQKYFAYAALALAFGLIVEIIQPFFGRDFAVEDLGANLFGVILGGVFARLTRGWFTTNPGPNLH